MSGLYQRGVNEISEQIRTVTYTLRVRLAKYIDLNALASETSPKGPSAKCETRKTLLIKYSIPSQ